MLFSLLPHACLICSKVIYVHDAPSRRDCIHLTQQIYFTYWTADWTFNERLYYKIICVILNRIQWEIEGHTNKHNKSISGQLFTNDIRWAENHANKSTHLLCRWRIDLRTFNRFIVFFIVYAKFVTVKL